VGEMEKKYSIIKRSILLKITVQGILLPIAYIITALGVGLETPLPGICCQYEETTKIPAIGSHMIEEHKNFLDVFENEFQVGQLFYVKGEFQNARELFSNYLKVKRVRIDLDVDLANLIGLGLSCEALGDYRFAEGYFKLASMICLRRWYMLSPSQCCDYFSGQVYGFKRLEPFLGLMRIAVQQNDLSGGFYQSERIHHLKKVDRVACLDQEMKEDIPKSVYEEKNRIRESFVFLFDKMKESLDLKDRNLFLELSHNFNRLSNEKNDYGSEILISPVKANKIATRPEEALLEYQITEHKSFAWIIQEGRIIKNFVIPISQQNLETKIREYLSTTENDRNFKRKISYNTFLSKELYCFLLKELFLSTKMVKKLIIIPDGVLWELPFENLINQVSKNEPNLIALESVRQKNSLIIEFFESATVLYNLTQKKYENRN
jgi:hypothetical protein